MTIDKPLTSRLDSPNRSDVLWFFRDACETGLYNPVWLAGRWVMLIEQGYDWGEDLDGMTATPSELAHLDAVLTRYVTNFYDPSGLYEGYTDDDDDSDDEQLWAEYHEAYPHDEHVGLDMPGGYGS